MFKSTITHLLPPIARLFAPKGPVLRFLLFHSVDQQNLTTFSNLISQLSSAGTFLSPSQAFSYLSGNYHLTTNSFVLTFDDGLLDNYQLALDVLEPLNIKAIFFTCPLLVNLQSLGHLPLQSLQYHLRNPLIKQPLMDWSHLRELSDLGHSISNHSSRHQSITSLTYSELEHDLKVSTSLLRTNISKELSPFYAYPFGTKLDISLDSFAQIRKYHPIVFSGLRGSAQSYVDSNYPIYPRESIDLAQSLDANINISLGLYDLFYAHQLRHLTNKCRSLTDLSASGEYSQFGR